MKPYQVDATITDSEIALAFAQTNFGGADHRKLLQQACLKYLVGYHCGFTLETIMKDLELVTHKLKLTDKGKMFCFEAFNHIRSG